MLARFTIQRLQRTGIGGCWIVSEPLGALLVTLGMQGMAAVRGHDFNVYQSTDKTANIIQNAMFNQSFEQGTAGYGLWPGLANAVYCDGTGFGSPCFFAFHRGSSANSSVYQDVVYAGVVGANYTAEAMVRCPPTSSGGCPITLAYWGLGITQTEGRSINATIPNNNVWYHCKVDQDHGGAGFTGAHSSVRWELYNNGPVNHTVFVDFTATEYFHDRIVTQSDPAPPPQALGDCIVASQFNN